MNPLNIVEGRIERRLLVNLRVDPQALAPVLPEPFRPLLIDGWAIAGMCLIRLTGLRPAAAPGRSGLTTENVAHRLAVEWDGHGERRTGVWIPHRHTSSRLTVALGGRAFPAVHTFADFDVDDQGDAISIAVTRHGTPLVSVSATASDDVTTTSVFRSMAEADTFFQSGSTGVSPTKRHGRSDVVDLSVSNWNLKPLNLVSAHSSIFEGWWSIGQAAEWDSAFIMRDMACSWHGAEGVDTERVLAGR